MLKISPTTSLLLFDSILFLFLFLLSLVVVCIEFDCIFETNVVTVFFLLLIKNELICSIFCFAKMWIGGPEIKEEKKVCKEVCKIGVETLNTVEGRYSSSYPI